MKKRGLPAGKQGLTLIEIVVVIAILAVLMIISMMAWRNHINKANDLKRKEDLQRISLAFEEYLSDNDCYPPTDILQNCGGNELNPYLDNIPCDPVYKTPYCYLPEGDDPTCSTVFRLLAPLENETDPSISKLNCDDDDIYCGWEAQCADPARMITGYNYGVSSGNVSVLNPAASPAPGASVAPSAAPSSPHPGGGSYLYACDRDGRCDEWDHFPSGCYFFNNESCSGSCSDSNYWCIE